MINNVLCKNILMNNYFKKFTLLLEYQYQILEHIKLNNCLFSY